MLPAFLYNTAFRIGRRTKSDIRGHKSARGDYFQVLVTWLEQLDVFFGPAIPSR